jgi:methionyl-tRNA synthetase
MTKRIVVTAALPYANGNAHLGHLVEYCQADMYVRALKRLGEDALYICASDAHGSPIELNAHRLGIPPEQLVARFHSEFQRDFARFDISFDHYSLTHSDTNRAVVERVYAELRKRGFLEDREMDGNWCEKDQRFLPDRFIKGTCPKCKTPDQYGDVCESCGSTYAPTDLIAPHCVLCGSAPEVKKSQHVFFKLSDPRATGFLKTWIDSGALQSDVANYVRKWVEGGLRDWCISRDGPYFGFAVPDRPNKFFYVWLDAPFGYVASSVEWGERHGASFADLWQSPEETRIEHLIGKDIVYFHTLFWPAVLNAVGYTLPSKVHVHGMLTIDGEKMSKTRGTFINASTFADHVEPQALRYYYACKYGPESDDLDLSLDDFVKRVNGELVNKHANLFSRAAQFLAQKLDNRLGELPFSAADAAKVSDDLPSAQELLSRLAESHGTVDSKLLLQLAQAVVRSCKRAEAHYRARELSHAIRELALVADVGNAVMQSNKPWDELKADREAARTTITFALNVCYALAMYLWPVVPRFAEAGARILGVSIDRMDASRLFSERKRPIAAMERLFERIDPKAVTALLEASKQPAKGAPAAPAPSAAPVVPGKATITYDDFAKVDLRVGKVIAAEVVPKSKKLIKLSVDVGEATPRQVLAGIAQAYSPESLVGTRVVVVANLAPAKLMGLESQGMLLAAGEPPELSLLRLEKDIAPGTMVK